MPGVPQNARFGQSILQVAAVDEDVGPVIKYSKVRETTSDFFSVDERLGIIRNAKLLYDIGSRQPLVTIQADDNGDAANTPGSTAETTVKVGGSLFLCLPACPPVCSAIFLMICLSI